MKVYIIYRDGNVFTVCINKGIADRLVNLFRFECLDVVEWDIFDKEMLDTFSSPQKAHTRDFTLTVPFNKPIEL